MAIRRPHIAHASQQELRFLGHRQKGSSEAADGEDDGSIAQSSIDLSQEFREVAPGCFSATLKRNFKAFCGRLGKWTHASKKSSSSVYRYLHINVPHPLFLQRQQSKSKQFLLDHPLLGFKDHAYISTHEEVKDIHLDPQFLIDGVKQQAHFTHSNLHDDDNTEEIKLHGKHPHPSEDDYHQSPQRKISQSGKHNTSHPPLGLDPNFNKSLQQHDTMALASQEGLDHQVEVLTSIHGLMLGVDHGLQPQASPSQPTTTARSPQAKPTMHLVTSMPLSTSSIKGSGGAVTNYTFERDSIHNRFAKVDNYLASLAAHVFSMRNQVIKGGFGGVYDPTLQGREETSKQGINSINNHNNVIETKNIKKIIAMLISTRKFEDLADLEEFLQGYMRLYSPSFLNMVDTFFYDICGDIFECESRFDNKIL